MKRGRKYPSWGSFGEVDAISGESEQLLVSKAVIWGKRGRVEREWMVAREEDKCYERVIMERQKIQG